MIKTFSILVGLVFGLFILLAISCNEIENENNKQVENPTMIKKSNPVIYFEIPVDDIDRAIKFYKSVFNFAFEKEEIDGNQMALFEDTEGNRIALFQTTN